MHRESLKTAQGQYPASFFNPPNVLLMKNSLFKKDSSTTPANFENWPGPIWPVLKSFQQIE
jgi:hypothetical protein